MLMAGTVTIIGITQCLVLLYMSSYQLVMQIYTDVKVYHELYNELIAFYVTVKSF